MHTTNIIFRTGLYAHQIEVTVNRISHKEAESFFDNDTEHLSTHNLSSIVDSLSGGDRGGDFESSVVLTMTGAEDDFIHADFSGTWRIVPNYEDIHRIQMWKFNHYPRQEEGLFELDFNNAFGIDGSHYYDKYTSTYNWDLWDFMAYLGQDIVLGEIFLTMVMEKVCIYETRISKLKNLISRKNTI